MQCEFSSHLRPACLPALLGVQSPTRATPVTCPPLPLLIAWGRRRFGKNCSAQMIGDWPKTAQCVPPPGAPPCVPPPPGVPPCVPTSGAPSRILTASGTLYSHHVVLSASRLGMCIRESQIFHTLQQEFQTHRSCFPPLCAQAWCFPHYALKTWCVQPLLWCPSSTFRIWRGCGTLLGDFRRSSTLITARYVVFTHT